ncbi:MAG: shikimate kinase [Bacteroidales bacterium]|nr:shikimate kinase [Bacteroidales bacterium]
MKKYAVAGSPVLHSKSPAIFNRLFQKYEIDSFYAKLSAKDPESILKLAQISGVNGLNITAPFKELILPYASQKDSSVCQIGACNTLVFEENISAYNFDCDGVVESVRKELVAFSGKRALVMGAGGAAKAAVYGLQKEGMQITVVNRTYENALSMSKIFDCEVLKVDEISKSVLSSFDLIVNTLEFPHRLFDPEMIESGLLLDANYKDSIYTDLSEKDLVRLIDGRKWLMHHAIKSFKCFTGVDASLNDIESCFDEETNASSSVICLSGMPGVGKSTLGKILAQRLGILFLDSDELIESHYGMSVLAIFEKYGESDFRKTEQKIISECLQKTDVILSIGGGAITTTGTLEMLENKALVITLMCDLDCIQERASFENRPLLLNKDSKLVLESLFRERLNKYFISSDLIFYNQGVGIEEAVDFLMSDMEKSGLI